MVDADAVELSPGAISCRDVMAVRWEHLDGALQASQAAAVRAHLATCLSCATHHEFDGAFLGRVAQARFADPARPELRRRVTRLLRARGLLS